MTSGEIMKIKNVENKYLIDSIKLQTNPKLFKRNKLNSSNQNKVNINLYCFDTSPGKSVAEGRREI